MSCLQNELILESIFEEAGGFSLFKWRETNRNCTKKIWGFSRMNVNLDRNVQILSEHYVNRFKHLIDTNRREDAYSIGQEYVCKGEISDDDYQWFFVNYQFKLQGGK